MVGYRFIIKDFSIKPNFIVVEILSNIYKTKEGNTVLCYDIESNEVYTMNVNELLIFVTNMPQEQIQCKIKSLIKEEEDYLSQRIERFNPKISDALNEISIHFNECVRLGLDKDEALQLTNELIENKFKHLDIRIFKNKHK
jgi:hypothetical protein